MVNQKNYQALKWVHEDIADALERARLELDSFINTTDRAMLSQLQQRLRQLAAIFALLGFYRLQRVFDEMLAAVAATPDDVKTLLMEGLLQLPLALEQMQETRQDVDIAWVLSLLNALRGRQSQALLSARQLVVDQAAAQQVPLIDDERDRLSAGLHKAGRLYQAALVKALQGQDVEKALQRMAAIWHQLWQLAEATAFEPLAAVATAFLTTMRDDLPMTEAQKVLLGQLDHVMRRVAKTGDWRLDLPADGELIDRLLESIAVAPEHDQVEAVCQRFNLLPNHDNAGTRLAALAATRTALPLLRDAVAALIEQLEAAYLSPQWPATLEQLRVPFDEVRAALRLLQLHAIDVVLDEMATLLQRVPTTNVTGQAGVALAVTLHRAEALLAGSGGIFAGAQAQVLVQCEADIANIMPTLELALQTADTAGLALIAPSLKRLSQVLQLSDQPSLAAVLADLSQVMVAGSVMVAAHGGQLLADVFVRLNHALACQRDGDVRRADALLQQAQHCVQQLKQNPSPMTDTVAEKEAPMLAASTEVTSDAPSLEPASANVTAEADDEIIAIFAEEADEVVAALVSYLPRWLEDCADKEALAEFRRAFHTLKGSGRMVGAKVLGDLAWSIENMLNRVIDSTIAAHPSVVQLTQQAYQWIPLLVDAFVHQQPLSVDVAGLVAQADRLAAGDVFAVTAPVLDPSDEDSVSVPPAEPTAPPVYANIFHSSGLDGIFEAEHQLARYQQMPEGNNTLAPLAASHHQLAKDAEIGGRGDIVALARLLAACCERADTVAGVERAAFVADVAAGEEALIGLVDALAAGMSAEQDLALMARLRQWSDAAADEEEPRLPDDIDVDILDIFMEEAGDIDGELEPTLEAWRQQPDNQQHANVVKRLLHTLKGGARLAGLHQIGDDCHQAETLIEQAGRVPDNDVFTHLLCLYDRIFSQLADIRSAMSGEKPAQASELQTVPVGPPPAGTPVRAPVEVPAATAADMVRISAEVLENLLNLSGEASINRGRIEQQVNDFSESIAEMGGTLERLYEQLRRLDIETDAQILSGYQQNLSRDGFDPLEMDQYSELHQIIRQLSESASDLIDLRDTLVEGTRDTETLLLQQARVNTELQERLMQTRMVPFSQLVPRLRRIVRQAAAELGKQVELEVVNATVELDRTLADRLVPSLEHMLRNAVGHGVEAPAKRLAQGKPAAGKITLTLGRDGGEVCLQLQDDGHGIDTDAVYRKALEKHLITSADKLSDDDVLALIFSSGFSTADEVTQLSGRGVGLDVVATDIRQAGGNIDVASEPGKGVRFSIRLPFTLALSRVLLVRLRGGVYAIPLVQLQGIVRIEPNVLIACLREDKPFMYGDDAYPVSYLGRYIEPDAIFQSEHVGSAAQPALLLQMQHQSQCLLVDSLIGSREMVIKPLGPPLASVSGVSGATIMGDGAVALVLDMPNLLRRNFLQRQQAGAASTPSAAVRTTRYARHPLVMVTDDSVTVRKFTTRMLERHGFDVVTAKDGVEAIALLEERRPDLMLLDIEMPRMGGFEVASHMRHDEHLRRIPIVMITSRTGEKHRQRAEDIGVDHYLGKPYQEAELLTIMRQLLAFGGRVREE